MIRWNAVHKRNYGVAKVKQPSTGEQSCDRDDLPEAHSTERRSQVALSVVDMPKDLAKLLDNGLEDHFRDR